VYGVAFGTPTATPTPTVTRTSTRTVIPTCTVALGRIVPNEVPSSGDWRTWAQELVRRLQNVRYQLPLGLTGCPALRKPIISQAAAWYPDGTYCQRKFGEFTSGGPYKWYTECADDSNGRIDFSVERMPEAWPGSLLTFVFTFWQAVGSGTIAFDLYCQCRGDGVAENNTWGNAVPIAATFADPNTRVYTLVDILPEGDCTPYMSVGVSCKLVVDDALTTIGDSRLTSSTFIYEAVIGNEP
jgi:hypothetical protein